MDKQTVLDTIHSAGLIAVLRGKTAELTVQMVDALVKGGIRAIEITYTTPNAEAVIRQVASRYGDEIVLGMGTLTQPAQATSATQAGARFLVSPHSEAELGAAMQATGVPMMMGAMTPSEVMQSVKFGSDVVKVFPGSLGGPSFMKALKGPFPDVPMMPTGGVAVDNIKAWFDAGALAVGAGSQLCPPQLAESGDFDAITALARTFVQAVADARGRS